MDFLQVQEVIRFRLLRVYNFADFFKKEAFLFVIALLAQLHALEYKSRVLLLFFGLELFKHFTYFVLTLA